jgi:acyl-CoA-dependent ceramide synthase
MLTAATSSASSFVMLLIPLVLYAIWALLSPYVAPSLSNPFAPLLFISHPVLGPENTSAKCLSVEGCPRLDSNADVVRYRKGWLDLVFVAYYIVVWSFVRQSITINLCHPIARYFGIKKKTKLDRFGEQGYAFIYFLFFGAWGFVSSDDRMALISND